MLKLRLCNYTLLYLLDLDEVLYALNHPLDDDRVVVLHACVNLLQTQRRDRRLLRLSAADGALYQRNFDLCHL